MDEEWDSAWGGKTWKDSVVWRRDKGLKRNVPGPSGGLVGVFQQVVTLFLCGSIHSIVRHLARQKKHIKMMTRTKNTFKTVMEIKNEKCLVSSVSVNAWATMGTPLSGVIYKISYLKMTCESSSFEQILRKILRYLVGSIPLKRLNGYLRRTI